VGHPSIDPHIAYAVKELAAFTVAALAKSMVYILPPKKLPPKIAP
jgi:hypothetical protein